LKYSKIGRKIKDNVVFLYTRLLYSKEQKENDDE
jgi:hypothetical protein